MNLLDIKKSGLHDYELLDIIIEYLNSVIQIKLNSPKNIQNTIIINNFISFNINHKEAWGKGNYICYSEIKKNSDISMIEIELNSGDSIIIEYVEETALMD